MNSLEITKILNNDPVLSKIFRGVYFLNHIPTPNRFPSAFVINVGRHWVALYCQTDKKSEYYDPLGRAPPGLIKSKFCITAYNTLQVQAPNTTVCGHFIIHYLFFKSRGASMKNIIKSLKHKSANEMVEDFTMHLLQSQSENILL